jgi:hypothetical protein
MDPPHIDSSAWTGEVRQPAALPYELYQRRVRPLITGAQNRAMPQAFLLTFSPLLLVFSNWLLHASIRDLGVGSPGILVPAMIVALAGAGLMLLADRNILPRLCCWIALAGWIVMIPVAFAWFAAGAYAHRVAVAGPVVRAQIAGQRSESRRASSNIVTTFVLQDGAVVETRDYHGGDGAGRGCFAVRWLQGPYGFAWLRIADASPSPGPGQLAWSIDPTACFSAAPLTGMGR